MFEVKIGLKMSFITLVYTALTLNGVYFSVKYLFFIFFVFNPSYLLHFHNYCNTIYAIS